MGYSMCYVALVFGHNSLHEKLYCAVDGSVLIIGFFFFLFSCCSPLIDLKALTINKILF